MGNVVPPLPRSRKCRGMQCCGTFFRPRYHLYRTAASGHVPGTYSLLTTKVGTFMVRASGVDACASPSRPPSCLSSSVPPTLPTALLPRNLALAPLIHRKPKTPPTSSSSSSSSSCRRLPRQQKYTHAALLVGHHEAGCSDHDAGRRRRPGGCPGSESAAVLRGMCAAADCISGEPHHTARSFNG